MIQLGSTILSDDIKESFFTCDLEKCKGACCVEGDLGAPLEKSELPVMEKIYEKVAPFLTEEGRKAVEEQGKYIFDEEGDYSTPTINGRECAYAVYDDRGILKCGIEQAHEAGEIDFRKPISCHLYPIRISKHDDFEAINYDRWSICDPACTLGKTLSMPLYKFLKVPLIRKYGNRWYKRLVQILERKENSNCYSSR